MGRFQGTNGPAAFDVMFNGAALLRNFDILKEAGAENRLVARTFRDLKPDAFGKLVFSFTPVRNYASLAAIEVEAAGY